MDILVTLGAFLGVLAVVVVVHEFGHFAAAKAFGVKVNEFGFGFPPRILGIRKGETLYSINLIPLGGFVKPEGEHDSTHPRSLAAKGTGTRFVVLIAGVVMNVVLAIVLLSAFFSFSAVEVRAGQVVPGAPADMAGILPGDSLIEMNGQRFREVDDLVVRLDQNLGQEVEWLVERDGSRFLTRLVPRANPPEGQGPTGISGISFTPSQSWSPTRSFPSAVGMAFQRTWSFPSAVKDAIVDWVADDGEVPFAGPVGIAQGTGEVAREFGPFYLIALAAGLSLALAISNILPIPPLDGGQIVFVVLEWARRGKRIPPEKQSLVHLIGIMGLIAFLVAVSYNDIMRLVDGNTVLP